LKLFLRCPTSSAEVAVNLVVNQQTKRKSELRDQLTVMKSQRNEEKQYNTNQFSSAFSYLSPFVGWDPIINVLSSPESFPVTLHRTFWKNAFGSGLKEMVIMKHEESKTFWASATSSLHTCDGKGTAQSGGVEDWKSFFTDYGCYETPRLWTFNERLMLMVACSWPAYYALTSTLGVDFHVCQRRHCQEYEHSN
jgi:hypothetical protein